MGTKTMKRILIIVLLGGIIGAAIGYRMWTKPHEKVEDRDALAVTAAQLCKDFTENEQKANTVYAGKALAVSGIVSEVKNNQDGAVVVTLQGDSPDASVQCTMRDKDAVVEKGKTLTVKGFFSSNDMFGVLVTDCIVL